MSVLECDLKQRDCDYNDNNNEGEISCDFPLVWGKFCNYEFNFIEERFYDIEKIYKAMQVGYPEIGLDGFRLNRTVLWEICFTYANDLKPIRQFHGFDGGCDKSRRAAFLARLVSLYRPIEIDEWDPSEAHPAEHRRLLEINQHLALHVLLHFLALPASIVDVQATNKVVKDLLFMFNHGDPSPEALVPLARLLTQAHADHEEKARLNKLVLDLKAVVGERYVPAGAI